MQFLKDTTTTTTGTQTLILPMLKIWRKHQCFRQEVRVGRSRGKKYSGQHHLSLRRGGQFLSGAFWHQGVCVTQSVYYPNGDEKERTQRVYWWAGEAGTVAAVAGELPVSWDCIGVCAHYKSIAKADAYSLSLIYLFQDASLVVLHQNGLIITISQDAQATHPIDVLGLSPHMHFIARGR